MSSLRPRRRLAATTVTVLTLAALAAAVLAGCGSSSSSSSSTSPAASASSAAGPITVTDGSGASVTLKQPATRIVSLAPANTEIAFAVGAGSKMVAGTSYDDYPAAAKSLPKIGDFSNPSVEKIASFNPDLVLAAGGIQASLRSKLENLGMTVYVVDPKTYDEVMTEIADVGKLAGTEAQAQTVVDTMQNAKDDVAAKVASSSTKPSTFLEIYSKPLMTAGSGSFILPARSLRVGTLLCFEAMYADLARQATNEGAEVLVNLSNDAWFGHPEPARQQLAIATLRAVENRRYLVRAAATGFSAVIDPHGRTLAESAFDSNEVLHATVHASHARSPYQRWGNTLAWLVIAGVAAASLRALLDPPVRQPKRRLT